MTERQVLLALRERVALLAGEVGAHVRDPAGEFADLHVAAEIREELSGPIDGDNRTFFSTRIPLRDASSIPLLVIRGLTYAEGDEWTQSGLAWWLAAAPEVDQFTDARPIAIYRCDPRLDVAAEEPFHLEDFDDDRRRRRRPPIDEYDQFET
jgi:hypothetical protein